MPITREMTEDDISIFQSILANVLFPVPDKKEGPLTFFIEEEEDEVKMVIIEEDDDLGGEYATVSISKRFHERVRLFLNES